MPTLLPRVPHACPPRFPVDTLGAALHMLAPQPHVRGDSARSSGLRCWGSNTRSLAGVGDEGLRALSLGCGCREGGTESQHLAEVRASRCCCKRRQCPERVAWGRRSQVVKDYIFSGFLLEALVLSRWDILKRLRAGSPQPVLCRGEA